MSMSMRMVHGLWVVPSLLLVCYPLILLSPMSETTLPRGVGPEITTPPPLGTSAPVPPDEVGTTMLASQPIAYVENRGQWDGAFTHLARMGAMTVFVQECGWTFTLAEQTKTVSDPCGQHLDHGEPRSVQKASRGVAVRMRFGGAAPGILVTEHRLPGVHNYFFGRDPQRWQTGVPLHGAIRMVDLYPGIDVRLRTKEGRFEYDLLLEPGADLASVVVEVEGASGLALDTLGALVIDTPLGQVRQTVPKTWQVTGDGLREEVACHYVLKGEGVFGFAVPEWDHELPLVVDPVLIFST